MIKQPVVTVDNSNLIKNKENTTENKSNSLGSVVMSSTKLKNDEKVLSATSTPLPTTTKKQNIQKDKVIQKFSLSDSIFKSMWGFFKKVKFW